MKIRACFLLFFIALVMPALAGCAQTPEAHTATASRALPENNRSAIDDNGPKANPLGGTLIGGAGAEADTTETGPAQTNLGEPVWK